MPNRDLLIVAGEISEVLEHYGLVACGRRQDGIARVDFWKDDGTAYRYVLEDAEVDIEDVVAMCLAKAGIKATATLN